MRVSNYTGQILLGMGAAGLAAIFYVLRDLLRHWRVWHLSAVVICGLVVILVWLYFSRDR